MKISHRPKRVEETIAKEFSTILDSFTRKMSLSMTTVTAVMIDKSLKNAKIKVSVLGTKEEQEKTFNHLNLHKKTLRYLLAQNIRIKYMPEIHFVLDQSKEIIEKIESLSKEENDGN
ncbi:30S ribosome-binding factor RbfA [candidate division WOR-3 bacterium]|nr:30S ribosome-binding factor RbfA [candidate division WOR-3 bacterium]